MRKNYIVITPARNEDEYIGKTLKSMVKQTILPVEWIIVNDGSTDNTAVIIEEYMKDYPWIKKIDNPPKEHTPGAGVVKAFYTGFSRRQTNGFDFVVKLDADLSFEPHYFEFQLKQFDKNPTLGITSGVTYEIKNNELVRDRMPEDHTRGAAKMYRKEVLDEIGGIPLVLGWDTIDELKAQMAGWKTRSYRELVLTHYKPIGFKQKKVLKRETLAGERLNYLGYHPLFALMKCGYKIFQKPYLIGGMLMTVGYLHALVARKPTVNDKDMIDYLRRKQVRRMTFRNKLIS